MRVAGGLLLARGFSGFSYAHIAEALQVQTAAIHYHFPTKAALGTALVEKYRARYRRWMDEAADQGFSPEAELEGYFKIALRFADDGLKACPGGVLQAEFAAIPAPMQDEVTRMMGEIQRWLAGVLERGRTAGAFHFEGDAMAKGAVVMATVQGALQVARALGRPLLDSALAQTRRDLGISHP